jgi:hypothetical protein
MSKQSASLPVTVLGVLSLYWAVKYASRMRSMLSCNMAAPHSKGMSLGLSNTVTEAVTPQRAYAAVYSDQTGPAECAEVMRLKRGFVFETAVGTCHTHTQGLLLTTL